MRGKADSAPLLARRDLLAGVAALPLTTIAAAASAAPHRLSVASPDGRIVATLESDGTRIGWRATLDGRAILRWSPLGLMLADGGTLGPGARLVDHAVTRVAGDWAPPFGIRARSDAAHREGVARFEDTRRAIRFAIVLRVYDAGIALRYRLLDTPGGTLTLCGEATEFLFPAGATLVCSRDEGVYQTTTQTGIAPVPHPPLTPSCDIGDLADIPLTVLLPGGAAIALTESDRRHFPRLMLRSTKRGVTTHLMRFPGRATGPSGPGDTPAETAFTVPAPFDTPWRVLLVADRHAGLIERQDLIPTLAAANVLGDVSWVKPGRAIRIRDYTTAAGIACVDFAVRRKLDYVEWDWHWYGDGIHDDSDATVARPEIDIRAVVAYARDRGIGMILYVDRVPAMRQLDQIVKTYRAWGVAGIKFGFIWEGRQSDTDALYDLVRTCGAHRLLVNLHDNLRPAGLERTLPNYLALEGVRGNEQFPDARHNVTLPFTRNLAGPIDYTICFAHERNRTTDAHQLAMAVVYYNPLTFLYWYDDPAKYAGRDWPALRFFDECPTVWHETRALSGRLGEQVMVARRHGARWFVGAMTNERARTMDLPLAFLGTGTWRATIFADGPAAAVPRRTPVRITTRPVTAHDRLTVDLAPSGGQAILFEPQRPVVQRASQPPSTARI